MQLAQIRQLEMTIKHGVSASFLLNLSYSQLRLSHPVQEVAVAGT